MLSSFMIDVYSCTAHGSLMCYLMAAPGSLPRGVLRALDSSTLLVMARVAIASQSFTALKSALRDVFSSLSAISASFLVRAEV